MMLATDAGATDVLALESPSPYQVIQRQGLAPHSGYAMVDVRGSLPESVDLTGKEMEWEYRVVAHHW